MPKKSYQVQPLQDMEQLMAATGEQARKGSNPASSSLAG